MTANPAPPPVTQPHPDDTLELARRRHLATCAARVRRLRGLFIPEPADRLALVPTMQASDGDLSGPGTETWTRLRRAAFAACDPVQLTPEDRVVLMAIAVQHAATRPLIFSQGTASALLELPSIGTTTELVEIATPPGTRGRKSQARRRRTAIPPNFVELDNLRATDVDRTIIDRARYASLESALAAADAALHLGIVAQRTLLSQAQHLPAGSRGCKMAELAMALADHRTESPLESLSRARMFQLGMPMPELQVNFYDAYGFIGRVDFFWRQLGIVGEADGKVKFRVAGGSTGSEAEDRVWQAKRRDDRLRRHPDVRDVFHWDWPEALNAAGFARLLAEQRIHPVPDGGWPVPDGPLPRKARHTSWTEWTRS